MRALAQAQVSRPGLHAMVVGEDRVAYGRPLPDGDSWAQRMLNEAGVDPARIRFTGALPRADYLTVLQASDAHVYLTVPFVLSWSFVEAMSVGCPIIASDVAPVQEAARGSAVKLVEHKNQDELADAIRHMLDDPRAREDAMRSRRHVQANYSAEVLWPKRRDMLARLLSGS